MVVVVAVTVGRGGCGLVFRIDVGMVIGWPD